MSNFQMQNNTVSLSGKVLTVPKLSHEIYSEKFYEIEIEVKRLSQMADVIPVSVSERLFFEQPLSVGQGITVTGQFRSYNKMVDERSKLMLTVFAKEVTEENLSLNPNTIELKGYICKPPIFRTTPFNREICDLLLAVNRAYNKSDYIPCIVWGRNARFCNTLPVGSLVSVYGRIQSRQYQKKLSEEETVTRTAYEVSVAKITLEDNTLTQEYSADCTAESFT